MQDVSRTLDEDTFDREFSLVMNPATDHQVFQHPEVSAYAAQYGVEHVWTLVDGDDDRIYAVPGFHVVNAFGDYLITVQRWTDDIASALYFDPSELD